MYVYRSQITSVTLYCMHRTSMLDWFGKEFSGVFREIKK